ncbi:MAG: abortive infection family protein [Roseovarius sp.]|nr:abortive infection family protein [Roseovarius sp.]
MRDVQTALKLHPTTVAPTAKGRDTIVRILSNLSQVAVGVAELRNEYGPDHGRRRSTSGLRPRHAHLAVGAAATYCRLLLETLGDRRAGQESSGST